MRRGTKLGKVDTRLRKAKWMERGNDDGARVGRTNWPGVSYDPETHTVYGFRVQRRAASRWVGARDERVLDRITSGDGRRRSDVLRGPGEKPERFDHARKEEVGTGTWR